MEPRKPNVAVRLELELLEDRVVPGKLVTTAAISVHSPDSYLPLRTDGGVALQSGSALTIILSREPAVSTLQITDDGKGDIQASWDGGPIHSFTGIDHIAVTSRVGSNNTDEVTYTLTGPLTGTQNVDIDLHAAQNFVTAVLGSQGLATPGLTFNVAKQDHLTVVK
jgi:hypothetical protein